MATGARRNTNELCRAIGSGGDCGEQDHVSLHGGHMVGFRQSVAMKEIGPVLPNPLFFKKC